MAHNKPSVPKGTRDFHPEDMYRRNYIFDTIREVFNRYGFQPIETPAMENLETLLGKYGDEGDKLLFRILNSGDFLRNTSREDLLSIDSADLSGHICDRGLRYDLTVPFARFVVQHRNEINFPFRRYQIQPVWRADRPQKGRYREFYQCDADVIGSDSLLNEAELISIIDEVFTNLGIRVIIKINNRKILSGLAGITGDLSKLTDLTVAIDKLEKTSLDSVVDELGSKGFSCEAIESLKPLLKFKGNLDEKISFLENFLSDSEDGLKGISEIKELFHLISLFSIRSEVELDLTLARGLNYYTGSIIEVKSRDVEIGSICGGGRYDDLTGIFGLSGTSGVGISFGADRIFDVLLQSDKFPEKHISSSEVLFVNFGKEEIESIIPLLADLRESGIRAELFPDAVKMKKQLAYADKNNIPYVVLAGKDELQEGRVTLKKMESGDQEIVSLTNLVGRFTSGA